MHISEYKNMYKQEDSHFVYKSMHHTIMQLLTKYLPSKKNLEILDAGCGSGKMMEHMGKYGKIYGIDISPEAIKLAKNRKVKNLKVGSILKLPYKDKQFDAVICIDVLYHQEVNSDIKAIREFYRVLKPGGILLIKVPAHDWLRGKHDAIAYTKHRYSKNEIIKKVSSSGFKVNFNSYGNMFIFPIALIKRAFDSIISNNAESDVQEVPGVINEMLFSLSKFEDKIMLSTGLPIGLSLYVVAKKLD